MSTRSRLLALTALGLLAAGPALAQQRGSISGKVLDQSKLVVPGVTVTVTEQNTGFNRTVITSETGAYTVTNLDPGTYTVTVALQGFATLKRENLTLTAGRELVIDFVMQLAGVQEAITVTADAPLVDKTSNRIGGTLSGKEIEDVPSNFRNFTALTQLVPGMTPNPAASTFEGGQVVANGTVSQSNVYLLDGMYNNDDRLGGSQGTQVRAVLDTIEEYQVLANQYSSEYGGGGGAIINMVTHAGTNTIDGRAYNYFRSDRFNSRNAFLPDTSPKPEERTLQTGYTIGGPIVKNRVHFFQTLERDTEKNAGFKKFPAAAAPLAVDQVGTFEVRAENFFSRGDVQVNGNNFLGVRWLWEAAPTKGENFNTNTQTPDARAWEADWDHLMNVTLTSVVGDRGSNVIRAGRVAESLRTGSQAFFADTGGTLFGPGIGFVGYDGKDPITLGQQNLHASYITGKGGSGADNEVRTYTVDDSYSYFLPAWHGEHTFKTGAGYSINSDVPQMTVNSGTFTFTGDAPYNPAVASTYPTQFSIVVGPSSPVGFAVNSTDHRMYFFGEDKWRASDKLTLNYGVRYDHQTITPASKLDFAPRAGFAWDVTGAGKTVVRGGIGRFNAYIPISVDLAHQTGLVTPFPTLTVSNANSAVLKPDVIRDSAGNLGVAVLSAAGIAELNALRAAQLAGTNAQNPVRLDSPNRRLAYQWSWSVGVNQQLASTMALTADYVGNVSHNQNGLIDINEPVNGVRPGVNVFDPGGTLIPAQLRTAAFQRVLRTQSDPALDGDYNSLQVSLIKRLSNRWSGRLAYTLQKAHYVGLGNPDVRRVWLDNEISADYGRFAGDRTHVLALSGTINPWRTLTIASVVSAISGAPINETTGKDGNKDQDTTNDRPIKGIDDLTLPIQSALDSQGRAVINGMQGPGSFLLDVSFRYQIPLKKGFESLDLFYDIFNLPNRTNLVAPSGNRSSALFMVPTAAQFPRQMQFGIRVRF